jgi:hypothetical protein
VGAPPPACGSTGLLHFLSRASSFFFAFCCVVFFFAANVVWRVAPVVHCSYVMLVVVEVGQLLLENGNLPDLKPKACGGGLSTLGPSALVIWVVGWQVLA